jgi:hypothetical protein
MPSTVTIGVKVGKHSIKIEINHLIWRFSGFLWLNHK